MPVVRGTDVPGMSGTKRREGGDGACAYAVEGCLTGNYQGGALLAGSPKEGVAEPGPCVVLFDSETNDRSVVLLVHAGGNAVPPPQTYRIAANEPDDPGTFWAFLLRWSADRFFVACAERGVVAVSSSARAEMQGTFEFEGEGCEVSSEQSPDPIQIAGSFAAPRLNGDALQQKLSEIGLGEECGHRILFSQVAGSGVQ